jgi:hypothetical protein
VRVQRERGSDEAHRVENHPSEVRPVYQRTDQAFQPGPQQVVRRE